ncbi:disease resistance protein RUN1-like [Juglans regia]|uniref:Disease resistance protein RUN1-like n=1 Tax=Juglans regia TaxID=51240 RepID=A0A6P9EWY6_JUGRE|nr:disease resistance protein RUN1-like [Juglans regia]
MVPLSTHRASSLVPPSSSTSPRPRCVHDVFLNFYGKDNRKSFTNHLYTALEKKAIIAFKDDEKLERRKYISQELLKAIRESMYAIPIISKNYASSRWCLIELALIVECMRETGLTVLPVFYHVDPSEDLVGIESRVDELMNVLGIGLDDVRFIGIHGMVGVGKTTLAEVIYDRISYQLEASSFIACIREETRNRGLVYLQKQLISKIFMERAINIWEDREGMNMIRNRLFYKKVFLVLDDEDRDEHLTTLAGSHDWFGLGSKIILTSRDNHLLKRHGVNDIYKVTELNNDEALQLFSLAAFKKPYLEENYVDLSKGFVIYAQGLPLALKVLGSSLFGRGTNAWKGAWDQLKANPNKGILDILQVGFDGLEDLQKKLFLDIACFFNGEVTIIFCSTFLRNSEKAKKSSFGSLKCFDLSGSQNLLETLDFTGVPSLETLDLEGYLSKVHKSIGVLKRLRRVNLHACKRLKSFPNEISLESLEHFYLSDCSRFDKFPDIMGNMTLFGCLSSLKILDVSDCLVLGRIQDMNGERYLEQLYKGGTAIKFTKFFPVLELGSNDACSTQEMFMTIDDFIRAFYIGFDDRVYYIRSLNHEESNLQTKAVTL